MITYKNLARVRRETENILLLVDELYKRGIPKEAIVDIIVNESKKTTKPDESPSKD